MLSLEGSFAATLHVLCILTTADEHIVLYIRSHKVSIRGSFRNTEPRAYKAVSFCPHRSELST